MDYEDRIAELEDHLRGMRAEVERMRSKTESIPLHDVGGGGGGAGLIVSAANKTALAGVLGEPGIGYTEDTNRYYVMSDGSLVCISHLEASS